MSELKSRVELLIGGVQIQSKRKNGIGTLGCIVFDRQTKKPLGLTNRHILKKKRGFSVIQPAGRRRNNKYIIGKILRKGKKGKSNDFAVFEIDTNNRGYDKENSIYELEGKLTNTAEPIIGMKVQKVGQRTGHSYGIIDDIEGNTITIIPNSEKQTNGEISRGGDSGSIWVTDEPNFKAVALHRAGEPEGSKLDDKAFAIPINRVLNSLNVTLV